MVASLTTKPILDGAAGLIDRQVLDVSGTGDGPYLAVQVLAKADGSAAVNPATSDKQDALAALVGEVSAGPTANTVLDRLKTIATGLGAVVIAAGTAVIGKVGMQVGGSDVSTSNRVPVTDKQPIFNAVITTLTRPADTNAYAVNDSISNSTTAGSVTALSCSAADANDQPVCISELLLDTTDTGLAAGVSVRAWLYNSDPTASSGVGAGDNAAFSNKRAGFIGTMSGSFRAFSDGGKARLVPDEGGYIIANPSSGGVTIWVQYQTLTAFTPLSGSTISGRLKGFLGRA